MDLLGIDHEHLQGAGAGDDQGRATPARPRRDAEPVPDHRRVRGGFGAARRRAPGTYLSTTFSRKKVCAIDELDTIMMSYERGRIFKTSPNQKYGTLALGNGEKYKR